MKEHLIFDKFDLFGGDAKKLDTQFTKMLTMGFKFVSAVKVGGITSNSVKELENDRKVKIDWERDIEQFVGDFNIAVELLYDCQHFKYLMAWNQSVMSLLGNSVALEFATLIFRKWEELDKPRKTSAKVKEFQKAAIILFDRLVYEYSSRLWTGSGDSHLARDLQDSKRFDPVSKEDWKKVIEAFLEGKNSAIVKGTLYYYYCLKHISPPTGPDITIDIDHIYAQAQFKNTVTIPKELMESIGNKALLPKKDNIAKRERSLAELKGEPWLVHMVIDYAGIKQEDFDKYSDINNVRDLIAERGKDYYTVFDEERDKLLNSYKL